MITQGWQFSNIPSSSNLSLTSLQWVTSGSNWGINAGIYSAVANPANQFTVYYYYQ
jgi:hypothetical protein